MISIKEMSGEDVSKEIEKRKGTKPSPGTIYPDLKILNQNGLIEETGDIGKEKKYRITTAGKKKLETATKRFVSIFCDMREEFIKYY